MVPVELCKDECEGNYDAVVIVATGVSENDLGGCVSKFRPYLTAYKEVDDVEGEVAVIALPENMPTKRLVYTPTGPLDRDYDDIRRFGEAAHAGIKRALKAGSKRPLLALSTQTGGMQFYDLVTILGALEALYVPLEIREAKPDKSKKAEHLGVCNFHPEHISQALNLATAIESGRTVARDIGGSDPERMSAPNVEMYVKQVFADASCIKVDVISDEKVIEKEYPLLAAVNRAARGIKRHCARVIFLEYVPEGPVETTVVLVGKGVTYDTGGTDIKAGGVMAGMHRDKCGAAAVAGFFQVLAQLKPKGIKVIGGMSMVRNSVGPDSYVADEIITSRAGVRVRVGNTDAEGRMAMADVLCHLKEKAENEPDPHFFTIATLTGHACLSVGDGYSIVLENGPAKRAEVGSSLQQAGNLVGDMFEISTIRREDYEFHKGKSEYEDVLQCNNLPSSRTPRGHQTPSAFLIMSSGLDKHGINAEKPLKYCHIDIAASSGPFPGIPSGAPVAAFTSKFILARI
ncbi:dipeptidase B isoform X2 [Tachypleus tridentatus]|uniref:dipeptidase B isoform X2 n=1 Tax=Tachypleus tridentatus TaxID=6853 RepID=UPI003FD63640